MDTLHLYDRIDNRIETRREVDSSASLDTRFRYDGNQNRVLTIQPEGNATAQVYDERDLLFKQIDGASSRPADGHYASGDPTTFDRPGGAGTIASTTISSYDLNGNLKEVIDAEDNGGEDSSAFLGDQDTKGDVTTFEYDGFDRRKQVIDSMGNVSHTVYDPDSNVIRTVRIGHPNDDVAGDTGDVTLAVTEFVHDNLSRTIATHEVLFETDVGTISPALRTQDLTDFTDMDGYAPYQSDATSDTAGVPDPATNSGSLLTPIGRITTVTEYDRLSRQTFRTQDDLDSTRTAYDGASRVRETEDSAVANGDTALSGTPDFDPASLDGNLVAMAYDDNDNLIERLETDVTVVSGVADETFRTTFLYDSLDRLQTSFDNLGQTTDRRYDSRSNLKASADPVGPVNSRSFARRGLGSTASVTINDFGNIERRKYDGINRHLETSQRLTASGQGGGS